MKRTRLFSSVAALAIAAAVPTFADEAWQQRAGVGQYAPAEQDWAEIEARAREEGQVIIYSVSSRVTRLADEFRERYGVEIIGHDIGSDVQLEKFRREHRAGIYAVDVLYNNETPSLLEEFLPKGMVWNFVPSTVADLLDEDEKEPFLTQRWSSRVLFYNTAAHADGPPIDSLWDLTRPEWSGKLLMPDPIEAAVQANVIQTILQRGDEMEAAYEAEFGEPIQYSEDLVEAVAELPTYDGPNAAMEWLYRLLQNDPIFVGSTNKIFQNVASVDQENPPMGIVTFSKLRDNEPGMLESAAAYGVGPVMGVAYPTVLVIADNAPHPNAAKLLIRHMMEEEGFEPWNVLGDYAARSDIEAAQVAEYGMPPFAESGLWRIDPSEVYATKYSFLQLYLQLR